MTSVDALALVKNYIESPDETVRRATEMLAENEDPRVRLLAEMWTRKRDEQAEAASVEEDAPVFTDAVVETTPHDLEWRDALIAKLKHRLRSTVQSLREEREVVVLLTSALGACHCLGEDPDCDDCHGAGVPGALAPDPECFTRFVLPVIRRIKERHRETAASRVDSPGRGDAPTERREQ